MTVSSAFVKDLETVRQALSHKFPAGGLEEVLHECVRVTLQTIRVRWADWPRRTGWVFGVALTMSTKLSGTSGGGTSP